MDLHLPDSQVRVHIFDGDFNRLCGWVFFEDDPLLFLAPEGAGTDQAAAAASAVLDAGHWRSVRNRFEADVAVFPLAAYSDASRSEIQTRNIGAGGLDGPFAAAAGEKAGLPLRPELGFRDRRRRCDLCRQRLRLETNCGWLG